MDDLNTAGIALHELMTSYTRAGFTRKEAMELVKASLIEAQRANNAQGNG